MNREREATDFFVAGGTLRPNTPSYVERPADDELFNRVMGGEFCYILTARQMGKSSLMIRTARRLREQGVHSVVIDLTKVGIDVSADQWYLGLLTQLKRNLRLAVDLEQWWADHQALGPVQRFTDFLHDVLLQEVKGQVVIFMDEIDTTLNLAFSDDFFAAIRFLYNARATDPIYEKITFVLLGVAIPADLIKDRTRTPFNIGQAIDLTDFSRQDAKILQQGLWTAYPQGADTIFERVFYWTNGHPYLTQKLCLTVAEQSNGNEPWTNEQVDRLVEGLFLSKEARKETNLQFVRDFVRNSPNRPRLLKLYSQIYNGKAIAEDERSLDQNQLKLFGLVKVENNALVVRNEIYRRVFNQQWIKENTPVDWTRRLVIVSGLIILLLVAIIGLTTWRQPATRQAQNLITQFRTSTTAETRLTSLAGLYNLPGYEVQANRLFYDDLSREERLALFGQVDAPAVSPEVIVVVRNLYQNLENNSRENSLLEAMIPPLTTITDDARAGALALEIKQWLNGRERHNAASYQEAVTVYNLVLDQNDRNPGVYFDRALAYAALGRPEAALADFETVLTLDPNRRSRVEQVIASDALLYEAAIRSGATFPAVVALVPSPTDTATPTPTNTATFTPTPTSTATPTLTPSPTPSETPVRPTATATVAVVVVVATPTAEAATATSLPTETPIPLPTPTPTPRPVTLVYVQSNEASHQLGIVSSEGNVVNADLHRWAAAPAWSGDGQRVAFYGEQGISQLGGIYAQGSGIWLVEVESGDLELLFAIDHIRNMAWSPDGTRLAFEVGPPGDITHQIYVIEASSGRELSRFAGEQPAWSPNGLELVIKSCLPECGLWRVGLDGGGGRLISRDSTDSYPTWSPKGKYIAFTSRARTGDWELYRLELSTEELVRLTDRPGSDTTPVFSPDGLEIYYRTDGLGGWSIRAMAVDGSNDHLVLAEVGFSTDWGLARPAVK
jgi:tetratricopeptide (TPR) repeat protein